MKANTKAFALFFAVLLATGQIAAGFIVTEVVAVAKGVVAVVYFTYRVAKLLWDTASWAQKFIVFLLSGPSLSDIPRWFLKNPPYFVLDALRYTKNSNIPQSVAKRIVDVMKEYSKEGIPCGQIKACRDVWEFIITAWDEPFSYAMNLEMSPVLGTKCR